MHECGKGEARGLYVVTTRGRYPYITGLYPTHTSVVSGLTTGAGMCSSWLYHREIILLP